jgi:hypothetical protein
MDELSTSSTYVIYRKESNTQACQKIYHIQWEGLEITIWIEKMKTTRLDGFYEDLRVYIKSYLLVTY